MSFRDANTQGPRSVTGEDLRKARLNRGFSRRGLADAIEVPENTLRRFEKGHGASPANALKIATWLGVEVTDLAPFDEEQAA